MNPARRNPLMGSTRLSAIARVYGAANSSGILGVSVPSPGAARVIRQLSSAASAAEPSTAPICRVVLYTPDPAPAEVIGNLRMAVTDSGDHRKAFAAPNRPRMV